MLYASFLARIFSDPIGFVKVGEKRFQSGTDYSGGSLRFLFLLITLQVTMAATEVITTPPASPTAPQTTLLSNMFVPVFSGCLSTIIVFSLSPHI